MPIEISDSTGAMSITGDGISLYRLLALRSALSMEMKGLRMSRRFSAYATIKREFGLKGSREKVYQQFSQLVDEASAKVERTHRP